MDSECYVCGQTVPGAKKRLARKKDPKPAAPVTPLSNLLFMASLLLTAVSLFSHQMSLPVGATLAGILFVARIVSDRVAAKHRLAAGPVTVPRLDR